MLTFVNDALSAAVLLFHGWPEQAMLTPKHLEAQERCHLCMVGRCDPEEARKAFIKAAEEAGILD